MSKAMHDNLSNCILTVVSRINNMVPGVDRSKLLTQITPLYQWMVQVYKFKDFEKTPTQYKANHDRVTRQLWIIQGELTMRTGDPKICQPTAPDILAGTTPIQPSGESSQPVADLPQPLPYTELWREPAYWSRLNPTADDFTRIAQRQAEANASGGNSNWLYLGLAAAAVVAVGFGIKGNKGKRGRRK